MIAVYLKDIRSFFSSLIAYIVIIVFLLITGLLLWVVENNTFDSGYSNLDILFISAPWVFLFLISAITMRTFSEEKKAGTLEILITKPLTDFQVIFGKYFAGVTLVALALLPTLIYFYTVYQLGEPVGNIDTGATWGSYFGLLMLGSIYVSIGLFASSLTDNQIVAFIISATLSAFMYILFDMISGLNVFSGIDYYVQWLGINAHYRSISRGVLDSRDLIYFISVTLFFLWLTKTKLESRKW
jgi:ABC-2 type transport system permease protein